VSDCCLKTGNYFSTLVYIRDNIWIQLAWDLKRNHLIIVNSVFKMNSVIVKRMITMEIVERVI